MAKLGEAYVQVRADLKGFSKDLDAQLKALVTKFEKSLNQDLGKKLGSEIGKGTSDGFKSSTKDLAKQLQDELDRVGLKSGKSTGRKFRTGFTQGGDEEGSFSSVAKRWLGSIVSTFEDGFSALPAELKAIIGASLLVAVVPLGAFLGAAVAAAAVAGVAGLGVALAAQFEEVRDRWTPFIDGLRSNLVDAASSFLPEVLAAFDLIELRMEAIIPTIRSIFQTTSKFVGPLVTSVVDMVDAILIGLNNGLQAINFEEFSSALITGFENIGIAIGDAFEAILSNPNLDEALADLLETIEDVIVVGGEFIDWSLDAWIVVSDVIDVVIRLWDAMLGLSEAFTAFLLLNDDAFIDGLKRTFHAFDEEEVLVRAGERLTDVGDAFKGTTAATKKQEKALKDLNKQLSDQEKLINDIISTNVDYEESIDRVTAGYKEEGASLKAKDEVGRNNITNLQNEINTLGEYTKNRLKSGELTEAQAKKFYDNEIKRIRSEHKERGGNIADFDRIFNQLIAINGIPLTPPKLVNLTGSANAAENALIRAREALNNLNNTPIKVRPPGAPVNIPRYADGGLINSPQIAMIGEGFKPEVVLPLSNPARSMQLLAQTPLAGMLGGGTSVAVFIGNEQLDARMYKVAQGANRQAARTMTQGPRTI